MGRYSAGMRAVQFLCLVGLLAGGTVASPAFSLLGPLKNRQNLAPDPWQGRDYEGFAWGLGYELEGDIGGPMFLAEAYRWNVPTIYYGFDSTFLDYFGQDGVEAVEQAVAMLNALPAASALSEDLAEYPLDTRRQHGDGTALQLLDLKSWALAALLEQLGLANPERFVWGLRHPTQDADCPLDPGCTDVIRLNYDPTTLAQTSLVNGSRYHFIILDQANSVGQHWLSAVEWYSIDPELTPFSSVAGALGGFDASRGMLTAGGYFTGLTRDDVGGLRFLLRRSRKVWETLLPDVVGATPDAAPVVGTALRGGVEKLSLARLPWDTASARFVRLTNQFLDVYCANDVAVTQEVRRVLVQPDILFRAVDLGGSLWRNERPGAEIPLMFAPALLHRGPPIRWKNNASLNRVSPEAGGPGVITPGGVITFNRLGRYHASGGYQWGSFDQSERPPVLFPGSETNHLSVTLETRLIGSVSAREFEWTVLLSRRWDRRYFHVESSPDLRAWQSAGSIDSFGPQQPIFAFRAPATNGHRFFRIREATGSEL